MSILLKLKTRTKPNEYSVQVIIFIVHYIFKLSFLSSDFLEIVPRVCLWKIVSISIHLVNCEQSWACISCRTYNINQNLNYSSQTTKFNDMYIYTQVLLLQSSAAKCKLFRLVEDKVWDNVCYPFQGFAWYLDYQWQFWVNTALLFIWTYPAKPWSLVMEHENFL